MRYFLFSLFSLLVFGSKLCAIDLDYPLKTESLLKLEHRVKEVVMDGINIEIAILEDKNLSEAFSPVNALPGYFRLAEPGKSSLRLRGRLANTAFFDWLSYRKSTIFPVFDLSSVSAYARNLKLNLEKRKEWKVEILNEDSDFKYDYGKVVVRPPNREPYEILKKPRIRPLGCEEYFIVDYSLKEIVDEDEEAPVKPQSYTFRDYLVPYKGYLFIYRVGIQRVKFDLSYYEEMDKFVRYIQVAAPDFL